jgi:hypothetical protein
VETGSLPVVASRTCWACGAFTHMTIKSDPYGYRPPGYGYGTKRPRDRAAALFECDGCGAPSVRVVDLLGHGHPLDIEDPDQYCLWLPERGVGKEFPDVPEHIAQAADEAHKCMSIGAHRAAMSLARAVIEATAKEKGIATGNLVVKIEAMHTQGFIREHVKAAAHEVRHLGNDMAHGDFVDPVDKEDAGLALTLVDEVLNDVFQSPAKVVRQRAARAAKKS